MKERTTQSARPAARGTIRGTLTTVVCALAAAAAWAAPDGVPRLDPTNGNAGTVYSFVMVGSSRSMDPGLFDGTISWRGSMTVLQDPGTGDFDADLEIDQNGDGIADRAVRCSGMVGQRMFAMRCQQDDGGSELRLLVNGKAGVLNSELVALRKAGGRGFSESHALLFNFQATQQ
jgi:hypothetical protein